MYKEQMDGSTMLFKGDYYCKAYNLEFLNKNFNSISKDLQNVKEIYYKPNSSRNSWFNYKKAILRDENKNLPYIERVLNGFLYDRLSATLDELPETEFVDYLGYTYIIGPRDGMDTSSTFKKRKEVLVENIEKRLEYFPKKGCYGLIVNFRTDITNAIITLNGLFEPYEFANDSIGSIIYYEQDTLRFPRDEEGKIRIDWMHVVPFIWDDVIIRPGVLKPIDRDEEFIIFNEELDSGCLLFYNKILYYYDVNKYNSRYVKLLDVDLGDSSNFKLDEVQVIRLVDGNFNPIKQQRMSGLLNDPDDIAYFPVNITNAIVTYNGVYHGYSFLRGGKSIKFKVPADLSDATMNAKIYAVNFIVET